MKQAIAALCCALALATLPVAAQPAQLPRPDDNIPQLGGPLPVAGIPFNSERLSRLPAHGRCITTAKELDRLGRWVAELACYVVEVCPECSWNHLLRTFPLGGRTRPG